MTAIPEQRSVAELDAVVDELVRRFEGRYPADTVAATVRRVYDELARRATITSYLPVLARHEAINRLSTTA